jgi:predicted nucleotidyltransferase
MLKLLFFEEFLFVIITSMTAVELQLPIPIEVLRSILRKNGVKTASIFGSYARGQATSKSDLDLLVELAEGKTYLDLGALQYELQEHYEVKADIATKLNRHFEPYITPELVSIL